MGTRLGAIVVGAAAAAPDVEAFECRRELLLFPEALPEMLILQRLIDERRPLVEVDVSLGSFFSCVGDVAPVGKAALFRLCSSCH